MARHLITSALPYINGIKHLGNLVGSMLPADVYARYLRLRGHEVIFICATDEHGTPAELAALEAGLDVEEYCRVQHERQAEISQGFLLSFDHFGRSSSDENRELTQHFARRLEAQGYIEERETKQVYSVADGRFLPDRYVIGTCPYCGYEAARGDQCESCTRLLDPTDLIDPRSAISGSTDLEVRETRHLFLLQSRLADEIRVWIDSQEDWPTLVTSIAYKWLDEGIEDRCITRDLRWGFPVDRPGFERPGFKGKVYYVWFDAPIEYIGATWEWANADPGNREWRSWWHQADDVRYTQFMAKDNIPFHTISWPATLIGSREPWKLVDHLKGFNWLNYYGGKFSTSRGVGVFMDDALELLPADYWRWYLIANAPESADTTFTWELFASSVNSDLADTLGNFVNRTLTFTARRFGAAAPDGGAPTEVEQHLAATLARAVDRYASHLEGLEFRKASRELRGIWTLGNSYLEQTAPWLAIREDRDRAACTLRTAVNLIRIYAVLAAPIIPATSERILAALGLASADAWISRDVARELAALTPGHEFTVPDVLFRKITDEDIAAWSQRFGGAGDGGFLASGGTA
ncbi:MAG: methionine--tRNA ligase [Egibacteraceae bacterium]